MENQEINQEQGLSLIDQSMEVIQTGSQTLTTNKNRAAKALAIAEKIQADIEANGGKLNADLDARCQKFLVNCNNAKTEMNAARAPFTQLLTAIAKEFTTAENSIDVSKPETLVATIQKHRDTYAKFLFDEQKRIEAEEKLKANQNAEIIDIRFNCETAMNNFHIGTIGKVKESLHKAFNEITLDVYDEKAANLQAYEPKFNAEAYNRHTFTMSTKFISLEEAVKISNEVKAELIANHTSNFLMEINAVKDELVEKLPSKLTELKEQKAIADEQARIAEENERKAKERQAEIDKADAAEKKRLQAIADQAKIDEDARLAKLQEENEKLQAQQRDREATEKLEREANEQKERDAAKTNSEMKATQEHTMNLFEQQAAIAEVEPTPEARQGYEIVLTHPTAALLIFQFWFERKGKDMPMDKLTKTSIDQMITFCEKHAHKNDEKIESKFITYNVSLKAVNRA